MKHIALPLETVKHIINVRMANGAIFTIGKQILLTNIGRVIAVGVFREKMIEGLFFVGAHFGCDGFIPFVGIVEFGININNDATERIDAMTYNRTNTKFCVFIVYKVMMPVSGARVRARIKRALLSKAQL